MKIKINGEELEFRFRTKQLGQLIKATGKDLDKLQEIVTDLNNASLLASLGTGKTIEEIEEMMDKDGTFECVQSIIQGFNDEVIQYYSPNSQSQTN